MCFPITASNTFTTGNVAAHEFTHNCLRDESGMEMMDTGGNIFVVGA